MEGKGKIVLDARMNSSIVPAVAISIMYVCCHILLAILTIVNGRHLGEAYSLSTFSLPISTIISILVVNLSFYILMLIVYNNTKISLVKPRRFHIKVNKKRFHIFFFILVFCHLIFYLVTGVGAAVGSKTSSISWLFSFFSVRALFFLYYVSAREKTPLYIANIAIFCIYRLLQGWMSFVIDIFILEFFLSAYPILRRYLDQRNERKILIGSIVMLTPTIMLSVGAFLYKMMYGIRQKIRFSTSSVSLISYLDAIKSLISRLSFFPQSVAAIQLSDRIVELYGDNPFRELIAALRPILPRFILPEKNFMNLNTIVKQAMVEYPVSGSSVNVGLPTYLYLLAKVDVVSLIGWIIITTLLCFLFQRLFTYMDEGKGYFNALYFYMLLQILQVSALEPVFSNQFFPILYILPFMLLLRIIEVKKGTSGI